MYNLIVGSGLLLVAVFMGCKSELDAPQKGDKLFTIVPQDYSGLHFTNMVEQRRENNHMINSMFISGGGVGVGDINNDGLQDVFFTGNQTRDRLYLNKGNLKFEDISDKAGITKDDLWSSGVTMADIDNDGDLDIYVCRNVYLEEEKSANQLYINNGDLTFTEKGEDFGLADIGFSVQAVFFDFDKDGHLDVYLVNQPPSIPGRGNKLDYARFSDIKFSDRLYKNMGNGRFVDHTDKGGIRNFAYGLSATVGDLNNDHWPDIYVTNDFDMPDHVYINQQDGTFENVALSATKHVSNFSMGSDIADYDNDGNLDVMVVDMMAEDHKRIKTTMGSMSPEDFWQQVRDGKHYQYMFNTLQRNNGNGTFSELGQLGGVTNTDWSWAPLFADFDNDGYKDLFVTNGVKSNNFYSDLSSIYDKKVDSLNQVARQQGIDPKTIIDVMDFVDLAPTDKLPNYIFKNNGDLTFTKRTEQWGMDLPTLSNGAAYADFDLDGDLDLVINNIDDYVHLYRNNSVDQSLGNFVRFKLSSKDNKNIYGTKVSIYRENSEWQVNEITNARGFMSKSEEIVHFGLGTDETIEKVVIDWPDATRSILKNMAVNKTHEVVKQEAGQVTPEKSMANQTMFKEVVAQSLGLSGVVHRENVYDDYAKEILLPHKMSEFGPSIAVGDVNGDGLEDFFMGGAAGFSGTLFLQNKSGSFDRIVEGAWSQDKMSEDMGVALVDLDGDKDLDLFIVSGGNEFEPNDPALRDRIYMNNGNGRFIRDPKKFPEYLSSGSCVIPHDFDRDGDLDLFVGGRITPGKYPHPANSYLLENRGGKLVDVTMEKASELNQLGLVTSAAWVDYNSDGLDDLVVVGEWMPVTVFTQTSKGNLEKGLLDGLPESEGWYYSIKAEDMDGDGDQDLIVGNLGLNYKYKASVDEPFEVYSYDFDGNGSLDIVLSYYEHGEAFPVRGKSCSSQQIPSIGEKFDTYEKFGNSDLFDIYGPSLDDALKLQAKTFASAFIENLGDGSFEWRSLPSLAQSSSINSILTGDYNEDGYKDLLISGNLYQSEIETPRNDAGTGLLLIGDGKGNFEPVSVLESGFFAPFDAKDMKPIRVGQREVVLVANNSYFLQAIEFTPPVLSNNLTNTAL